MADMFEIASLYLSRCESDSGHVPANKHLCQPWALQESVESVLWNLLSPLSSWCLEASRFEFKCLIALWLLPIFLFDPMTKHLDLYLLSTRSSMRLNKRVSRWLLNCGAICVPLSMADPPPRLPYLLQALVVEAESRRECSHSTMNSAWHHKSI